VTDPTGRTFRMFAEQTKSDLRALAACMRRPRQTLSREQLAGIKAPVLVAVGSKDDVAGSGPELAALIPGARALDIPGRDHMLAVGTRYSKPGCSISLTNAHEPCAGRVFGPYLWVLGG